MNWWRYAKEVQQNFLVRKHKISSRDGPNSEVGLTLSIYIFSFFKSLLKENHSF